MNLRDAGRATPGLATAVLLGIALASMVIWTRNIGIEEDWSMVDPWLGRESDLFAWAWSQNNEHRLPIGRLIYLALLRATDDFRSGMVASQLLLAGLSLILIKVAIRARGGEPHLSDVLFPLALLNLGHWENLLWGWQIQFVSSVFLSGLLLATVASAPRPGPRASLAAGAAIALLPMSGANGIVLALGMAPWALFTAFLHRDEDRRSSALLSGGAFLAIAGTALYFTGYVRPPWSPPPADSWQFYHATQAYFAMATGTWARPLQITPGVWTGSPDGLAALFVLAVLALGASLALFAFVRRFRFADSRSLGLLAFISCNILLGVIIAYSRGALPYYMPSRFALFATLPFLAAIFAVQLYGPKRPASVFSALIAVVFLALLPFNTRSGFEWRNWYVAGIEQFEADLARNLPLEEIAERNTDHLLHSCDGCLQRHLRHLRAAGVEPYASIQDPAGNERRSVSRPPT